MQTRFTKMHGAGNDFIVFDNLDGNIRLNTDQIRLLCDRRFGVGADGVLLLEKPNGAKVDARMIYYNSDGSRGEMCGNGARCFTAFALSHGIGGDGQVRFMTDAGPLAATEEDGLYTIQMTPPTDLKREISLTLEKGEAIIHSVNTGVPHVVQFVDDLKRIDLLAEGKELRFHDLFAPKGANVNFAHISPMDGIVRVRTYERGVEAETLACGTGVTATAILAHLLHGIAKPVRIQVAGGDVLQIDFECEGETVRDVTLTGPATVVFEGTVDV